MKQFYATLLFVVFATTAAAETSPDIVLLGEVHDNVDAHRRQAEALEALNPSAVVFEMLTSDEARKADADRGKIPSIWAQSDWPEYSLYEPIFEALGDARIVGAAAPRETIGDVYGKGAAALFGADAGRFGLDAPLPEDQQAAREAHQFAAHCEAMPREMMAGMVEVQRYRDAVFARAALEALDTYGPPVAVIAGNGHARTDWGVPAVIARVAPEVSTRSVAFVEGETDMPFDETHVVPPAERDDPCLSLTTN
ncbi:Uncharacterized iron-regulated protein [Salinihabitans flavidus]|uniref:Uncharacterized iron-regulated protein n=1 Tax=Salinihabitans flavidus TaxID=569882 RepID=A0A1H8W1T2_9RHOB|nr:ChaN family lipoprotein [Salinihabitans flavidus]SEP21601.1 Uncharacterized iron-regulated protein [Salinihabitans flavidus]